MTNLCILQTKIQNCNLYSNENTCQQCKDYFLLVDNECLSGSEFITNCMQFSSKTVCTKCAPKYVPIPINSKTACHKVDLSLTNCQKFDDSQANQGKIKCTDCINGFYPLDLELCNNVYCYETCVQVEEIFYCKTYDASTNKC